MSPVTAEAVRSLLNVCGDTNEVQPTQQANPSQGVSTMWQNFSLLFNAIDSENSLGYAISCQACKICQSFCL